MTDERIGQRQGSEGSTLIRRFRLTATLQPGASATARRLRWNAGGSDWHALVSDRMNSFEVHATFFRAFGAEDEEGWAMFHLDSGKWEVISMEGCLLRHGTVTESGGIAEGATGDIALYWNNDSDTEATLGITIQARNIGAALDNGDKVQVWYEPHGEKWYVCNGTGSGGAIVSVAGATKEETTCLWAGKIQSIEGSPTGFCTNQFTEGEDCWLLVMDPEGGSTAGFKATLTVGEFYFGHLITTLADVPVYAIRISSQIFHATCPSPGVAAGATISVTLQDGRSVTVTNWSDTIIDTDDKIHVYHDRFNDTWYAIKAGGAEVSKIYHAEAVDDIAAGATATVELVVDATQLEATNWSDDVAISTGDKIHVYRDPLDGNYYAIKSGGGGGVELYSGTLSSTLQSANATASVGTLTAFSNEATISPGTVNNTHGLAGTNGADVLVAKKMVSGSPTYVLIQVDHISLAVDKNVKVDSATDTTKIQQTKRTVAVMSDGNDDSADTDVVTLADQDIAVDVKVDSTSNTTKLQYTKKTIKRFPTTASTSTIDWLSLASKTFVVDVLVDNPTTPTKLQYKTHTFYAFPQTGSDTTSDVIGIRDCP